MPISGADLKTAHGAPVLWTQNLRAVELDRVPVSDVGVFRRGVLDLCASGGRLVALSARAGATELLAVVARDSQNALAVLRGRLTGRSYPALAADLPAAQAFEREIMETHEVRPEGHPWLKPLRRHADLDKTPNPGEAHTFFRVEGSGVHEVAVGPVHAGIIEPGHFRFQCAGEKILHLEIQLGYQHRGVGPLFVRAGSARRSALVESIAGDTVVGHAIAYTSAMEALAGIEPPLRAQALRGIALELERLANHVGDLGALCNDIGYLPGSSWLGRARGEFLNLLLDLSGNRFGRSLVKPGGVRFDLTESQRNGFVSRLATAERDVQNVVDLMFAVPTVVSRFEQAGPLARDAAEALGVVGPAARASGCDRDVRRDHPSGIYRFAHVPVTTATTGDVMARALVRSLEVRRSFEFLREQLRELPAGVVERQVPAPKPERLVLSLVEGWRGQIVHLAEVGSDGLVCDYKIVDPSFYNWFGLAMAMRGQPISDFPLCNKSFNLSYAGHDL